MHVSNPQGLYLCCLFTFLFAATGFVHPKTNFEAGTLFVIVLEADKITIASDSRTVTLRGEYRNGIEKVKKLDGSIAFLLTGFSTVTYEKRGEKHSFDLYEIAEDITGELRQSGKALELNKLADSFASVANKRVRDAASNLGIQLFQRRTPDGGFLDATFAGLDTDGTFKVVTVHFKFIEVERTNRTIEGRLRIDISENRAVQGRQEFIFLGHSQAIREAISNPQSPLHNLPVVQAVASPGLVDPVAAAESLVDLGIRYALPESKSYLGFPVYVHVIDKPNGLRQLKP